MDADFGGYVHLCQPIQEIQSGLFSRSAAAGGSSMRTAVGFRGRCDQRLDPKAGEPHDEGGLQVLLSAAVMARLHRVQPFQRRENIPQRNRLDRAHSHLRRGSS